MDQIDQRKTHSKIKLTNKGSFEDRIN